MNKFRVLILNEKNTVFQYYEDGQKRDEQTLLTGYESIAETFFKGEMPSEASIEYAINFIEDELMSYSSLVNDGENLIIQSVRVKNLFMEYGLTRANLQREEVENLFNSIARSLINKQATAVTETNPVRFSLVLLLREIAHHLKFAELKLVSEYDSSEEFQ